MQIKVLPMGMMLMLTIFLNAHFSQETILITNVSQRYTLSLNGLWQAIVDP